VSLDGVSRDVQAAPDLFNGQMGRQQFEHALLGSRQRFAQYTLPAARFFERALLLGE
jgi:hypothetical protein